MRKNDASGWDDFDDRVPAGLANAMRAMRPKSEVLIRREARVDSDIYAVERGVSVDMTDSTEVFGGD